MTSTHTAPTESDWRGPAVPYLVAVITTDGPRTELESTTIAGNQGEARAILEGLLDGHAFLGNAQMFEEAETARHFLGQWHRTEGLRLCGYLRRYDAYPLLGDTATAAVPSTPRWEREALWERLAGEYDRRSGWQQSYEALRRYEDEPGYEDAAQLFHQLEPVEQLNLAATLPAWLAMYDRHPLGVLMPGYTRLGWAVHAAVNSRRQHVHPDAYEADLISELAGWPVGIAELANLAGVNRQTVDNWRRQGELPRPDYTVSGRPAWRYDRIHQWIDARAASAAGRRRAR